MKILVIGAPLSGKSSLAKKLAKDSNLIVYHTDDIVFKLKKENNLSTETFDNEIEKVAILDNWIIEGRHISKIAIERADKVIWLKTPFLKCLIRKIRQSGLNIALIWWFSDQIKNQYFGNFDIIRTNDPTYSHNKKYELLLRPHINILES